MQELVISMVRLSTASTLFGIEQLQSTVNAGFSGGSISRVTESVASAFEGMADGIAGKMDESMRATLDTVVKSGGRIIADTFTFLDPMRPARTASSVVRGLVRSFSRRNGMKPAAEGGPRLAVDALSPSS
ncbi:MAG TPA: hypothetical protein VJN43_14015 [Bryobacteraceae bacterium]|nr:hypothetical protein [Bryobacteraceae bacterium]